MSYSTLFSPFLSEGEDYTSFNDTLTFLGGSNPDDVIYFNVSITNDECYEESIERFNITILEAEENVYFLDQSTSVNIEDDEGKNSKVKDQ